MNLLLVAKILSALFYALKKMGLNKKLWDQ